MRVLASLILMTCLQLIILQFVTPLAACLLAFVVLLRVWMLSNYSVILLEIIITISFSSILLQLFVTEIPISLNIILFSSHLHELPTLFWDHQLGFRSDQWSRLWTDIPITPYTTHLSLPPRSEEVCCCWDLPLLTGHLTRVTTLSSVMVTCPVSVSASTTPLTMLLLPTILHPPK